MNAPARLLVTIDAQALRALNERIEALEAENDALRQELGLGIEGANLWKVMEHFHVARNGALLLLALHAAGGRARSKAQLLDALHHWDHAADLHLKNIDVYVCGARKKLGRDRIENVYGFGFLMTAEGRQLVDEALERPL